MKKILFVCTGNICRSSTAEAMLRDVIRKRGCEDRFCIDSCGTHGYHVDEPSDPRAMQAAKLRGIDIRDIRARQIDTEDFENFDHMIAMDRGHLKFLNNIAPKNHRATVSLFLDHSSQKIKDVPDPYYGDLQGFEEVLDVLEKGMDGLLAFIDGDLSVG